MFKKSPRLGIEITSASVRMAASLGSDMNTKVLSVAKADLQPGMISETYSSMNIHDRDGLAHVLKTCLDHMPAAERRRAALCLPDGMFRVQTLEFDELPAKPVDRERLIRWRLEKTAAFDLSDTLLRYQVLRRRDAGFTVLACIAKKALITQYEDVLIGLDIEPWSVGLSSFSALNLYAPYVTKKNAAHVLTHVTEDSFATIMSENGGARFYRFKDFKRGSAGEIHSRLVREIEDSLHFYTHRDPSQQTEVGHLYLSGEPGLLDVLARELTTGTSLDVEVLSPAVVLPSAAGAGAEMAAALGAGKTL